MIKNKALAIQLFKRSLPELVSDACQLEGIDFTVPEIQTLLGRMSVGNKYLHEQDIALNQIGAWKVILSDSFKDNIEINRILIKKCKKKAPR